MRCARAPNDSASACSCLSSRTLLTLPCFRCSTSQRHTIASIVTADPAFAKWAHEEPESASAMARGLRRWLAWVGELPSEATRAWLDAQVEPRADD